jgi:hypothetical protein
VSTSALTYKGLHKRLRRARGRASEHACIGCGAQAQEWSYDHVDINELRVLHRGRLVALSADPFHYEPRCSACHRHYDINVVEARAAGL